MAAWKPAMHFITSRFCWEKDGWMKGTDKVKSEVKRMRFFVTQEKSCTLITEQMNEKLLPAGDYQYR